MSLLGNNNNNNKNLNIFGSSNNNNAIVNDDKNNSKKNDDSDKNNNKLLFNSNNSNLFNNNNNNIHDDNNNINPFYNNNLIRTDKEFFIQNKNIFNNKNNNLINNNKNPFSKVNLLPNPFTQNYEEKFKTSLFNNSFEEFRYNEYKSKYNNNNNNKNIFLNYNNNNFNNEIDDDEKIFLEFIEFKKFKKFYKKFKNENEMFDSEYINLKPKKEILKLNVLFEDKIYSISFEKNINLITMKKIICNKIKSINKKYQNLTTNNFDINFDNENIIDLDSFIFDFDFQENDVIKITNLSENFEEENEKIKKLFEKINEIKNFYYKKKFYFNVSPKFSVLENLNYLSLCDLNNFEIETNFIKITFKDSINLNEIDFDIFKNQIIKPFITKDDIKFKCKIIIKNFNEKSNEEYKENLKFINSNLTKLDLNQQTFEYSLE